jgi:pyruvate-formate lyase-activating enzyme
MRLRAPQSTDFQRATGEENAVYAAYTDGVGNLYAHEELRLAASNGREIRPLLASDCVPVPEGSDFFSMPGRKTLGWDSSSQSTTAIHTCPDGSPALAVSTFLAPAWTRLQHPATQVEEGAPILPLYAYSALGFLADGTPVSAAIRVDPDPRQDPTRFQRDRIEEMVQRRREELPENRLVRHVSKCALVYGCRAAQNYFLGRWEAPIPIARACNATCIGCISFQKEQEKVASHDRIGLNITADEVAGLALDHIGRVPTGIVSFGQGCEGEPLLNAEVAIETVRTVRSKTALGTMHLNSNASKTDAVRSLVEVGLDSMRVSLNSARTEVYERYYRPGDYGFEDVIRSMEVVSNAGLFLSLNFLVFPGITDTEEEFNSLMSVYERAPFHMIQWRNLNVDPDEYLKTMDSVPMSKPMGLETFIEKVEGTIPGLRRGYFNPPKERFNLKATG